MPSKQVSRVLFMQEDAQINVSRFCLAVVGVQTHLKAKALSTLPSALTHNYFPSTPSLHSDPASESPCPRGTLLKVNVLGIYPHSAVCGSEDEVTQGSGSTCDVRDGDAGLRWRRGSRDGNCSPVLSSVIADTQSFIVEQEAQI